MESDKEKPGKGRIAYPDSMFVGLPMDAFATGLLAELSGREVKRWLALLRGANQQSKIIGEKFQISFKTLGKFDGASQRTAYRATRGLEARGVIWFESKTRPFTYILNLPSEWRDRAGRKLATGKPNLAPAWPKA